MDYALVKRLDNETGVVENVIVADEEFIALIADQYDHIEALNTEAELALNIGLGWSYSFATMQFTPPAPSEPLPVPERRIAVGSFFDRFGEHKFPILADPDLFVQAFIKDVSVRQYIDLNRPDLPYALDALLAKGYAFDKDAVINTPVQDMEKPL